MDQFHDGHHVWLRSRALGTYLHADDDGQGVSLRESRASLNAAWAVQQLHHRYDLYLLLRSAAYGRYLAATNTRPPLGHPGFRVAQRSYAFLEVGPIMWQAFGAGPGNDGVLLRDVDGRYLRANGKHIPWNHGASVDEFDHVSNMRHWIVEPIPARQSMPVLPATIRASFLENLSMVMFGRVVAAADRRRRRLVRFVRAANDGAYTEEGWSAFQFTGRSVQHLRYQLANHVQSYNFIMCVRAGLYGTLTPLVVDLPSGRNGDIIEIVLFRNGTPGANALRHPDVDAE
ncbi:uncharacterized protein [Lolium perenne]|uniref:uncharacterized protein n=1 Tax=Lolium perenne TaxID=4522 RepID=UPI0021F66E86|nr:uncharacterized protein LOC127299908 [Lolium perenne]